MNEYKFIDLRVGQNESFKYVVTDEAMKSFCSITGDMNPLHTDEAYAKSHGYKSNVVYGMLTASLISTLAGIYLPGKYCLIQQTESKFIKPVFAGDRLTVKGEVVDLHESVSQAEIKVTIINQDNEKVLKGTVKVGFLE